MEMPCASWVGQYVSRGDASVTEGRASVTWYPWSQFGVGLQYSYTRLKYNRDLLITELGGEYQYDGVQILASIAF